MLKAGHQTEKESVLESPNDEVEKEILANQVQRDADNEGAEGEVKSESCERVFAEKGRSCGLMNPMLPSQAEVD